VGAIIDSSYLKYNTVDLCLLPAAVDYGFTSLLVSHHTSLCVIVGFLSRRNYVINHFNRTGRLSLGHVGKGLVPRERT
jgi:hypothetical protein